MSSTTNPENERHDVDDHEKEHDDHENESDDGESLSPAQANGTFPVLKFHLNALVSTEKLINEC